MTRPGQPPGNPDPWDTPLSAVRSRLGDLGSYLAVWSARTEPDALLTRMREGPPGAETASGSPPRRPPPDANLTACPAAKLCPSIAGGDDSPGAAP